MSNVDISLSANTSAYVRRLKAARTETDRNIIKMEQRIDRFASQVQDSFQSSGNSISFVLNTLRGIPGGGAVAGLGVLGVSATAAAVAIRNVGTQSLLMQQELSAGADMAGITTDSFIKLAHASKYVGVETDGLTDIFRDFHDKLGDFVATGQGGFQDFFDVVGKGSSVTVDSLKQLSGMDGLQAVVNELERVGASKGEIVFTLESLASNSSKLYPLLRHNAAALREWNQLVDRFTSKSFLSPQTMQDVKLLDTAFTELGSSSGKFFTTLSANMGLTKMFAGMSAELTGLMDSATDYMNQDDVTAVLLKPKFDASKFDTTELTNMLRLGGKEAQEAAEKEAAGGKTQLSVLRERLRLMQIELDTRKDLAGMDSDKNPQSFAYQFGADTTEVDKQIQNTEKVLAGLEQSRSKHLDTMSYLFADAQLAETEAVRNALTEQAKLHQKAAASDKEQAKERNRQLADLQKQRNDIVLSGEIANAQTRMQYAKDEGTKAAIQYQIELATLDQHLNAKRLSYQEYREAKGQIGRDYDVRMLQYQAGIAATEYAALQLQHEAELTLLNEQLERKYISQEYYNQRVAKMSYESLVANNETLQLSIDATEQAFSALSGAMREGSKEQKAAFIASKAAAIANITINGQEALSKIDATSLSDGEKLVRKIAQVASTGAQITAVTAQALGQFHSGEDEVAQTGSYILKQGERVVQPAANRDLTAYLKEHKDNTSAPVINADLIIQGDANISPEKFQYMLIQHRENIAAAVKLAQRENPSL